MSEQGQLGAGFVDSRWYDRIRRALSSTMIEPGVPRQSVVQYWAQVIAAAMRDPGSVEWVAQQLLKFSLDGFVANVNAKLDRRATSKTMIEPGVLASSLTVSALMSGADVGGDVVASMVQVVREAGVRQSEGPLQQATPYRRRAISKTLLEPGVSGPDGRVGIEVSKEAEQAAKDILGGSKGIDEGGIDNSGAGTGIDGSGGKVPKDEGETKGLGEEPPPGKAPPPKEDVPSNVGQPCQQVIGTISSVKPYWYVIQPGDSSALASVPERFFGPGVVKDSAGNWLFYELMAANPDEAKVINEYGTCVLANLQQGRLLRVPASWPDPPEGSPFIDYGNGPGAGAGTPTWVWIAAGVVAVGGLAWYAGRR